MLGQGKEMLGKWVMRKREVEAIRSAQEAAIRDLDQACYMREQVNDEILPAKVWEARRVGVTWAVIGETLGRSEGVSAQAASQWFARVQARRLKDGDFPIGYEGLRVLDDEDGE